MEFNKILIKYRKEAGLTQQQFASKLGYTRSTISAWELGRNQPNYEDLIKITKILNVSLNELLNGTATDEPSIFVKWYNKNKHKIDKNDEEMFIRFMESYLKSRND